jgi:hypothetical protein
MHAANLTLYGDGVICSCVPFVVSHFMNSRAQTLDPPEKPASLASSQNSLSVLSVPLPNVANMMRSNWNASSPQL